MAYIAPNPNYLINKFGIRLQNLSTGEFLSPSETPWRISEDDLFELYYGSTFLIAGDEESDILYLEKDISFLDLFQGHLEKIRKGLD